MVVEYDAGAVTFRDRVAIAAPAVCTRRSEHEVMCAADDVSVYLEDGHDRLAGSGTRDVYGGPGNDRIVATGFVIGGAAGERAASSASRTPAAPSALTC